MLEHPVFILGLTLLLLHEMDAVAGRVQRIAGGWEAQLDICVEDVVSQQTVFDLVEAFCGVCRGGGPAVPEAGASATRLRLRTEVLAGVWEALSSRQVDLAIGVADHLPNPGGIQVRPLGDLHFVYCVAPHHPLAALQGMLTDDQLVQHRAVAVADTAQRLPPMTLNLLPGQDVMTVPNMRMKLNALLRCLGAGFIPEPLARPHVEAGTLVQKETARAAAVTQLHYAWRAERGGTAGLGRALQWWLGQLESPTTRRALLERHAGPLC